LLFTRVPAAAAAVGEAIGEQTGSAESLLAEDSSSIVGTGHTSDARTLTTAQLTPLLANHQ
jgi:hypothetical protein